MPAAPSPEAPNAAYYDAFSASYDDRRGAGYHKLIDDQAAALVERVARGRRVLEVGCGTGLILERVQGFAREAVGIDLSAGMLARARARGLPALRAAATALPFADGSFDVAYSFKVLAHVDDLAGALREMARVLRPGGHLVFDVYNRRSLRYLIKRAFGPRRTSARFDEAAIGTRFLRPAEVQAFFPAGTRRVSLAGIRVLTPHPAALRVPALGAALERLEWRLMDSRLSSYAGFLVFQLEKLG